jgi:hypothetical protein
MLATSVLTTPIVPEVVVAFGVLSFMWLPLVFAAYAIGRKRVGLKFFFIVTTTEAVAVALALYLHHEVFVQ